ncbi:hypothetical protein M3929_002642 [Vibrio metschnikovii]|nr:hypothetical protein [Vibrio metschnikovii]
MGDQLFYNASESSDSFILSGDDCKGLHKAVITSMFSSFDANTKRVFIVVCSDSEQKEFIDLLEESGRIERHLRSRGDIWLKGAESFNGIPTVMFKQCRAGNEEALAGFCLKNARMFINGDYITDKGLQVARASMTEPDNAITLYKEVSPVVESVYISGLPKFNQ